MKAIIEKDVFMRALSHVQSVVERRNTIPILSNILLVCEGSTLTVVATDLELEIKETLEAQVTTAGGLTASAQRLHDIVSKLPDGAQLELSQETGSDELQLFSGTSVFLLQTLPQDDFPQMKQDKSSTAFSLQAQDLSRLLRKAQFAISTEETRYYLNGVYLHICEEEGADLLRAVATDGHRLAQLQMVRPEGAADMPPIIVPRKTVGEVLKVLDDKEDEVSISISDVQIVFTMPHITLMSKLVDGKYPDYKRVIPVGNDKILSVDAKAFTQCVERVSAVSGEKTRAVKLNLQDDKLKLSVSSPTSGNANDEISVAYKGKALEVGFNGQYLTDITKQIDGTTAVFEMGDSTSPTLIRDEEDGDALYVLMPMRV
ncbi:MAG: DNA polymerase III subunit beta [Alphaproteobacteria bacterium]|nr:DNA polymerase III subunit beta [Alphaproteobacteria bacterium]MBE8220875.1 DNA polymerase III subunit beta [Alphaproteobacteria bacterium]